MAASLCTPCTACMGMASALAHAAASAGHGSHSEHIPCAYCPTPTSCPPRSIPLPKDAQQPSPTQQTGLLHDPVSGSNADAALRLNTTVDTIEAMIRDGRMLAVRFANRIRALGEELDGVSSRARRVDRPSTSATPLDQSLAHTAVTGQRIGSSHAEWHSLTRCTVGGARTLIPPSPAEGFFLVE